MKSNALANSGQVVVVVCGMWRKKTRMTKATAQVGKLLRRPRVRISRRGGERRHDTDMKKAHRHEARSERRPCSELEGQQPAVFARMRASEPQEEAARSSQLAVRRDGNKTTHSKDRSDAPNASKQPATLAQVSRHAPTCAELCSSANAPLVLGPLLRWNDVTDDDRTHAHDPSAADSLDGPGRDEPDHGLSSTTERRAQDEDDDRDREDELPADEV